MSNVHLVAYLSPLPVHYHRYYLNEPETSASLTEQGAIADVTCIGGLPGWDLMHIQTISVRAWSRSCIADWQS